jgi:outer membrane biosynthesis protein TonB
MARHQDLDEDSGRPSARHYLLMFGSGAAVIALMVTGVLFLLGGDRDPPRKVQDLQIVAIIPPPPPPPPPPPEQKQEDKVIDQVPVKQEMIEEKAVDIPKDAPPEENEPLPGPPALDDAGKGPGDLAGKPGGRGFIGSGGGGGGSSRWGYYASMVQTQIEAALKANEKTRHAVMKTQVRLWADGSGRVTRVQLTSSSGDAELDAVLRDQVLSALTLREPPPKDMPMPIIMRLSAQKPS